VLRGWFDLTPKRRHFQYGMGGGAYWEMGTAITLSGGVGAFILGDWWVGLGLIAGSTWSAREALLLRRAGARHRTSSTSERRLTDAQAVRDRLSSRKRLVYVLAGTPLVAIGVMVVVNGGSLKGGGVALAGALLVWCGLRNTTL
jgi:hypothetical protein